MYLNLVQIAESFGVSESVVTDWIRDEGLPHTQDRGRLLFDRAQVATWAAARGLAAHAGFLALEESHLTKSWRIDSLLKHGGIWRDVGAAAVPDAFLKIVTSLPGATPAIRQLLASRLAAPGGVAFAPVGGGFALPHPSSRVSLGRDSGVVAILLLADPLIVNEPVPDHVPITKLIFFVAPSPRAHLDLLGRLSRMLSRGPLRETLSCSASSEEIFRAVESSEGTLAGTSGREPKP